MSCREVVVELGNRYPEIKWRILISLALAQIVAISAGFAAAIGDGVCPWKPYKRVINLGEFVLYFTPMIAGLIILTGASFKIAFEHKNGGTDREQLLFRISVVFAAAAGLVAYINLCILKIANDSEFFNMMLSAAGGFLSGFVIWFFLACAHGIVLNCKECYAGFSAEIEDIRNKLVEENPM